MHNTTQSFPWRLNDGELENLVKPWYSHVSSTSKTVKNHRIVHTHPLTGRLRHTWEKGKGAMAHLQVTLHWASVCTTTCNSWGSKVAMCTSFLLLVRLVGDEVTWLIAFHTILATCSGENVRVTKQPSNMPLINTVQRNYMIYCIQDPSMYCCQVQLIKTANLRTPKATTNLSTPTATEHTHWSL